MAVAVTNVTALRKKQQYLFVLLLAVALSSFDDIRSSNNNNNNASPFVVSAQDTTTTPIVTSTLQDDAATPPFFCYLPFFKFLTACSISGTVSTVSSGVSTYSATLDLINDAAFQTDSHTTALEMWENLIQHGVPRYDTTPDMAIDPNFVAGCTIPDSIDDVYICVGNKADDGKNGILVGAGPDYIRQRNDDTDLVLVGSMYVDTDDLDDMIAEGSLMDNLKHGYGHIMGVGTLWDRNNLVTSTSGTGCTYIGANAVAEYQQIIGTTCDLARDGIPLDDDCIRWDGDCIQNDIMGTPNIIGNAGNIVSRMTVGSLEDLGYEVNYQFATSIEVADTCKCPSNVRQRRTTEASSFLDEYFPSHGASRQLLTDDTGSSAPRQRRRKLSADMKERAITHGRRILQSKRRHLETTTLPDDVKYVGDKVMAVTVRDYDGSIHSVIVRHDD